MRLSLLTPSVAREFDRDGERGATLLVSIAILTLLFIFSIAFVRLVSFERTASVNYTDSVRARMLARAGIERAVAELQRIALRRHYSHPGDPITAPDIDPLTAAAMGDAWAYSDALQNDSPQKATYNATTRDFAFGGRRFPLDLHSTLRPSFRMQDTSSPVRTLYGDRLTYSGLMGASYAAGADVFKLKVLDTQRMLDLNHPDLVSSRRMLKNLLRAVGVANAQALANAVMDRRPPSDGFRSKSEVEAILVNPPGGTGTGVTAEFYRSNIRDLITVYAWRDEKVIRPWAVNTIEADVAADLGTTTGSLGGSPVSLVQPARRELTLATERAPINLNTAPKPVLVALFAEAKAVSERYGSFSITFAGADWLADQIIARRQGTGAGQGPFRTWNEFEAFVDGLSLPAGQFQSSVLMLRNDAPYAFSGPGSVPPHRNRSEVPTTGGIIRTALTAYNQGCKDLIKAVANPNTMVSKFGIMPNHGGGLLPTGVRVPRLIDKSDLTSLTTEACLDAMGVFEITSIGMVLIPGVDPTDLKVVAAQTEQKVVKVYDIFRLTTQLDFEQNRALMVKGDFIEALDNKRVSTPTGSGPPPAFRWPYTIHGTNKQAFQGYVVGWPGMVTWPNYSLDRQDRIDGLGSFQPTGISYTTKQKYVMAQWDGHMMLSNLIAYIMQDMDFVMGFARGKLDAFKVRGWWDPRQTYNNGEGAVDDASNGTDDDGDGFIDEGPSRPADENELSALATPLNKFDLRVRLNGIQNPAESQLIDEDLTGASALTANDLFVDGSSLWNTGVVIHPFRRFKGAGSANDKPQFICYDSGNLDLTRGFSLRFWTQPLADAFLQQEEVLCSFVGSRGNHTGFDSAGLPAYSDRGVGGGDTREVGFRIIKEVTGSQVYITLESVANTMGSGWAFPGNGASISIDVTPTNGVNNPIQPQWFPGTWHWVVLNLGPRQDVPGKFDATIQVDMAQYQSASALEFWGSYSAFDLFGEVHGFAPWGPTPYDRYPLDAGYSTSQYFRAPHLLGDWYNCEGGGSATQNVTTTTTVYGPNAVVLDATGNDYTVGPDWPSNPFPAGSYDHEISLRFTPAAGDPNGPAPGDAPMSQGGGGGFSGWSKTFAGDEMGTDQVPGGHEWLISAVVSYKMTTFSGSFCNCCEGPPLPGDVGYPGADPRNLYTGKAQGCDHDSSGSKKSGYGPIGTWVPPGSSYSGWFCSVQDKVAPPLGPFSGYVQAPSMEFQCDDCHGCESCDIDGPIFFGGEPNGGNYGGMNDGAAPQGYDLNTMAYAVFDNIIMLNNMQRRTDNTADLNRDFYEDRFYETNMAYMIGNPGGANTPNFGAQYHRALLELAGRQARIGTLTWTAYPSTENLRFEVGLYCVDGFDAPLPAGGTTFRIDNATFLNGSAAPFSPDPASGPSSATDQFSDCPIGGLAHTAAVTDSAMPFFEPGLNLAGAMYDGEGVPTTVSGVTPTVPKILVLGIRLRDTPPPIDPTTAPDRAVVSDGTQSAGQSNVVRSGTVVAGTPYGTGARGSGATALPQPLLSTPVFEDFTMTLIPDRTTTLYAEEGVEE